MPFGTAHHRPGAKIPARVLPPDLQPAANAPGLPAGAAEVPPVDTGPVVRIELSLKSMLTILAVGAGLWLLVHVLPALLVLVMALMLVGALHPLVKWLEARKVRRFFAVCVVFGGSALLVGSVMVLTLPSLIAQVRLMAEHEPKIRQTVVAYLDQSRFTTSMADGIRNTRSTELLKSASGTLFAMSTRVLEIAACLAGAVFLAFYMMIDRDRLRGALYAIVPRKHHIRLSRILLNLGTIVGGYIRGQALTCVLMGIFIFVLLLACGVPNALAFAVFGGVMDLLPYIGIFLTMTPVVIAAAVQSPTTAIIVFLLMLAYEELESRVLVPLVYGRSLRLPSSIVFFALILGTALAGIVGTLLALPLAAAVLMLVEELRVELPGETILPKDIAQHRVDVRTEQEYERRSESMTAEKAAAVAVEISVDRKEVEEAAAVKAEATTDKQGS
jgi:predicted PurR-regulated permease PerM